jgi:PAS domain S-box-containing protein
MAPLEIEPHAEIDKPIRFERLLAEMSTFFINLPADRIDSEIEAAQRRVCRFLDIDRSTLWQVHEGEPGTLLLTHLHQPPGSLSPPERMNAGDFFPWTVRKVLDRETLVFSNMTDLPPEADRDRETFGLYGTKSGVYVPLSVGGGPVFGLLTFAVMREERSWPETVLAGFKLIAQVFANALARKQIEKDLRESEARLSVATDAAGAGLWIMEPDSGYVWATPKTRELFLFAPDEALNYESFFKAVHPEDRDRVKQAMQQAFQAGEYLRNEYRIVLPNGSIRWMVARGQGHLRSAGKPDRLMGVSIDITERKQAEEALRERLQFEHLLSSLSARFVNMPPDQVDAEIEDGLRRILEFFQVDRCGLLRLLPGKTSWQISHVAFSDNVPPIPAGAELPGSLYPWAYEKLAEKHEVMSISSLDDLPAAANVDRQTCTEWGIRSYVNIPILIGKSVTHIIHVSSVKSERVWPKELFPRLRLLGEIFVNGLERKRAEEASQESERMLRQNESDLRELAGRLIYAQEEERSRLARELHDDLAQRLAVVAIDVGRLELQLLDPPPPVRQALDEMKTDIVRISQDVHSLSRQLHPSILDDLGLIKAVESECAGFSKREGIEVVFNHDNIPRVIPKDVSLSLYRIIQEGLRNIAKYACAEHASVSLQGIDHDVLLSVQDDGIGFDWAEVKQNPGLGFLSMRERARLIYGELSIKSEPEKGTVITVRAPLQKRP